MLLNILLILSIVIILFTICFSIWKNKNSTLTKANIILLFVIFILELTFLGFIIFKLNKDNTAITQPDLETTNNDNIDDNDNSILDEKDTKDKTSNKVNTEVNNNQNNSAIAGNNNKNSDVSIDHEWYKKFTSFTSQDGSHTFSLGWLDNNSLEIIFDSKFVISETTDTEGQLSDDKLIYKGKNADIQINYHYKENKVEVIDNSNSGINYSGIYNYS